MTKEELLNRLALVADAFRSEPNDDGLSDRQLMEAENAIKKALNAIREAFRVSEETKPEK